MRLSKLRPLIILVLAIVIISIVIPVQATSLDNIISQGTKFIEDGKEAEKDTFDGDSIKKATDTLYSLFFGAGIAIAVIVGAYLGVKFMTEGIEGKAKIKEALVPFVIGCIIIFGGFSIWKIAMNLFSDIEKTESKSVSTQQDDNKKCSHRTWIPMAQIHQCQECGYYESHTDMKTTGRCSKCGKKCDKHDYHLNTKGEKVECSICGTYFINCEYMGKNNHQWNDFQKPSYCIKCHIPYNES